ncbi:DNA repair protein RecO [Agriterribacter sp.]|uniref:DNA repair protein RecO n=1 Tax=Agriterribacter sp. TaxID=2821509 RepID=UPI002C4106D5|nr:DNA repair protein RecO [Agriterribacter sp.]HTN05671.1 DNA repair protein RecO [Agriterribacter sp.]
MVHTTKGIVLRTVSYGETSVIALLYTELFGLQSYIVNGLRTAKKSSVKNNLFQASAILEMEVYHNELKSLQRIKGAKWHFLYQHIFFNIPKSAVALFMTELLQKVIRQPEHNPHLYSFIEDAYMQLDKADTKVTAGYPLFFALHLTSFLGFNIRDTYTSQKKILDLREGEFVKELPMHPYYIEERNSAMVSQLLKVMHPYELHNIDLPLTVRRELLEHILQFYALHIQDFGVLKSLPVLQEVLA